MGNFYQGVVKCSRRIFCSEISTQISEHFRVYLRLHGADHSDLGIIEKKHATMQYPCFRGTDNIFLLVGSTVRHGILGKLFI